MQSWRKSRNIHGQTAAQQLALGRLSVFFVSKSCSVSQQSMRKTKTHQMAAARSIGGDEWPGKARAGTL